MSIEFWAKRKHSVIHALVAAGAFPDVDEERYSQEFRLLCDQGWPPQVACDLAFANLRARSVVSACEVHPW